MAVYCIEKMVSKSKMNDRSLPELVGDMLVESSGGDHEEHEIPVVYIGDTVRW
jgi:hypothetical protein